MNQISSPRPQVARTKRAQNKLDTTRRILEAAISVFSEQGYMGAKMDDIASGAGISKPTLYQYFASKEALFGAMMEARRDDMLIAFDMSSEGDLVGRLYAFAWRYAKTVMNPEFLGLARLIVGEAQRFPEIGRAYQASGPDQVLAGMMDFLSARREAGELAFEDAELAAEDLWGLLLSAPRTRALTEPDFTPDAAQLARFIHNGLAVFLRAYSTTADRDLERLQTLIAQNPNGEATWT